MSEKSLLRRLKSLAKGLMYFVALPPPASVIAFWRVRCAAPSKEKGSIVEVPFCRDRRYVIALRAQTTDLAIFEQIFVLRDCDVSLRAAPHLIVDCGAHVGCSARYFASRFPDATIVAVEAERSNFDMLVRNVRDGSGIVPIHAAVWGDKEARLAIMNPDESSWGFRVGEVTD